MAYRRGTQSVEVELARLQGYAEDVSDELSGTPQKHGLISLVRDREAREVERKESRDQTDRHIKMIVGFGALIPTVLALAEHFHWF